MEKLDQFVVDLEDAIEDLESGSLKPETEFKQLPEWDSLALLSTIAMIDYEYGVSIKADEVKASDSVQDLYQLMRNKQS